ncbi:hypothetical protein NSK_001600 [Nannochloropsis salina CCMP1776]|uniref:Uncharacterized protein n=1 Tax=Nannochloropsis salina CCMP1776 TaxID=1027361 RepID=A0A4D9DEW8_9STRA|nr:hypothetical protein NSK_001600 [Nannochloropsis salina CCMP1776]|eukprot:TFJ87268.1 hypothetical protein NSK_001600 [Nannochloropsis salina CCMP1776]
MSSDLPMLIVSDMLGQRPQNNEAGNRDFNLGSTSKEVLARQLVNRKEDESPFKKISTQENYTLEESSRMGSRKRRIKTGFISDCPPQMDFHTTAIKCIIM